MKQQDATGADGPFRVFNEIVDQMPAKVSGFFEGLRASRLKLQLSGEAETLNEMARLEFERCRAERREPVLLKWFEIFRDIYVASLTDAKPGFTFFARTFEPLPLSADAWFADPSLVAPPRGFREKARAFRLAFERYLYHSAGARKWCALDWEMEPFAELRVAGSLQRSERRSLKRLAALALTAHDVFDGSLNLSLELRDEVSLPLSGLSNEESADTDVLTYYHFDRHTQLSFARAREIGSGRAGKCDTVRFEPRWRTLAVLSDVILRDSHARATRESAGRVMADSCLECADILHEQLKPHRKSHLRVWRAVEWLREKFEEPRVATFAGMGSAEIAKALGVDEPVIEPAWYLTAAGVTDGASFWREAGKVFDDFAATYRSLRRKIVCQFTLDELENAGDREKNDLAVFEKALSTGDAGTLQHRLFGTKLRDSLAESFAQGHVEFQYADLARLLLAPEGSAPDEIGVRFVANEQYSRLKRAWAFPREKSDAIRQWMRAGLADLARRTVAHPGTGERLAAKEARDYRKTDFVALRDKANEIWRAYFERSGDCLARWRLSLLKAMEIYRSLGPDNPEVEIRRNGKGGTKLLSVTWSEGERQAMLDSLRYELAELEKVSDDRRGIAELSRHVRQMKSVTPVELAVDAEDRAVILLAVLARLIVATAKDYPGLWDGGNLDQRMSFFLHVLTATMKDPDVPFPWHVGFFSSGYLRHCLARVRHKQWNCADHWLRSHAYEDSAERQVLLMYVADCLKDRADAADVIRHMGASDEICGLLGKARIHFLSSAFEGAPV